jgi:hypothetical protein
MSVNEMNITLGREDFSIGSRLLGSLAMLGAPMLFIFIMFGNTDDGAAKTAAERVLSMTGVVYMCGWICGAIGMRRLRATGDGFGAKILFVLQIALLICGAIYSVMETAGYNQQNGGLIFAVADAGWPLSHLLMLVVGIFVLRAKVWQGWPGYAPFLVGIALPLTLAVMGKYPQIGGCFFGSMTALGLGVIGWTIQKQSYKLIFNSLV